MRNDLGKKDASIAELNATVARLNKELEDLAKTHGEQVKEWEAKLAAAATATAPTTAAAPATTTTPVRDCAFPLLLLC